MRILFTSVGLSGHLNSIVPLAWSCRAVGHDIVLAVPDDARTAALHTGLPLVVTARSGAGAIDPRHLADARSTSDRGRLLGRSALACLDGVRRAVHDWEPDVVVSERAEFAGRAAAAEVGVPWVAVRWSVAALPEYDIAAARIFADAGVAVGAGVAPSLIVSPWPATLRSVLPQLQEFRYVTFEGAADLTDRFFTRSRGRRVCLTLGTVLTRSAAREHAALAPRILAELTGRGLEVVVAADPDVVAGWGALPDGVLFAGRAPLSHLLRTSDVAVHHGGHGTALTTLAEGLPAVVVPAFDDQIDNAVALATRGAAVVVDEAQLSPAVVADSCEQVLAQPATRAAARSMRAAIRACPPLHDVALSFARLGRATTPTGSAA